MEVLVNNDEQGFFSRACHGVSDPRELRHRLEGVVDRYAELGIDTVSWCLWSWFTCEGESSVCEKRRGMASWDRWDALYAVGEDPVAIIASHCRRRGVRFIAGLRMNDRHGQEGIPTGRFITDHPEFLLHGLPGGPAVDFKHAEVRRELLAYIEDMLARYDVSGVELDYMRWCHMFQPGEGHSHANALTEFMTALQALLGDRLCGARLPCTLSECDHLGFDVAAWCRRKLVDYICPGEFFCTDFSLPLEAYVALAKPHDIRTYLTVHHMAGASLPGHHTGGAKSQRTMGAANFRAAWRRASNAGANGLQTYNIFGFDGEGQLEDVSAARGQWQDDAFAREYLEYPGFWNTVHEFTGLPHVKHLRLDGSSADTASGCLEFVIAEPDPAARGRSVLEMTAVGLDDGHLPALRLNGAPVPPEALAATPRPPTDGLVSHTGLSMTPSRANCPPLADGENSLEATAPTDNSGDIFLSDLEVRIPALKSVPPCRATASAALPALRPGRGSR